MEEQDRDEVVWFGYEYAHRDRSSDWYWAISIISISIFVIAIIYNNPLFGVFILLAGITLMLSTKQGVKMYRYQVDSSGMTINQSLIPYTKIVSFWISESKYSEPRLLLRIQRVVNPVLIIPIETDIINPSTLRAYLIQFINEEKMVESISHKVMEKIGF